MSKKKDINMANKCFNMYFDKKPFHDIYLAILDRYTEKNKVKYGFIIEKSKKKNKVLISKTHFPISQPTDLLNLIQHLMIKEITKETICLEGKEYMIRDNNISYICIENSTNKKKTKFLDNLVNNMIKLRKEQNKIHRIKKNKALNKAREKFLADISHDIKTPLNGIIGTISLLEESKLTNNQKEYIKLLQNSSYNLMELVSDLLDLAKLKSGKVDINKSPFHLETLIKEIINIFEYITKQKDIKLTYKINKNITYIKTDKLRLKQVLVNLIGNAIKFTPADNPKNKRKVQVIIKLKKGSKILHDSIGKITHPNSPKFNSNTDYIQFTVKDFGIGIRKKDKPNIFSSFVQTYPKDYQATGVGLGLSICYCIANLLDGCIYFSSEVGKGSEFYFEIPYKEYENIGNNILLIGKDNNLIELLQKRKLIYKNVNNYKDAIKYINEYKDVVIFVGEIHNKVQIKNSLSHYILLDLDDVEYKHINRYLPTRTDKRILIVEDDECSVKVMLYFLENLGIKKVDNVGDGESAIKLCKKHRYDYIFMDLQLPNISGLETAKQIKEIMDCKIIAFTAGTIDRYPKKDLDIFDDFIFKPVSDSTIIQNILEK